MPQFRRRTFRARPMPTSPSSAGARPKASSTKPASLREAGISANHLPIRWLVPLHGDAILDLLKDAKHTIIVENNFSGQFARYLRSETSFVPNGHIRKYDGEPFMPHHIVEAVKEQLAGQDHAVRASPRSHGLGNSSRHHV